MDRNNDHNRTAIRKIAGIVQPKTSFRSFTLLELIVVIIIIGILATLGLIQYTNQIEYSRTAEAKAQLSTMRKLAYEYYLKNGTFTGITNTEVGADYTCTSDSYYRYAVSTYTTASMVGLFGKRCTSGGKSPSGSREYNFYIFYFPTTGGSQWVCRYVDDLSSCFGYSSAIP